MKQSDSGPREVGVEVTRSRGCTSIRASWRCAVTASGLTVAILEPPCPPERVILMLMGFRGWLDPFEMQRFMLLADRLNARIVVPETPGCSRGRTRITFSEGIALVRGRFDVTARRMLSAARPHLRVEGNVPVHLMGYSLGASIVSAMATEESFDVPVHSVTLVEPVAIRRWPVLRLVQNTRHEDSRTPAYVARNAQWTGSVLPSADVPDGPRPTVHMLSMLLQGNALRRGRIPADLAHLRERNVAVVTIRGTDSGLCLPQYCRDLIVQLRRQGLRVVDLPVPGGHALWHSLDDVAGLADRLRHVWTTIE